MELTSKKTLVLGAGKSGVSSARFLAKKGAVVALHDRKPISEWSEEAVALKNEGVGIIDGDLPSWLLDQIELVVISPGIPTGTIPARYVDRKDGEVIGEIELAYRFMKGRIVGITGSNGKTTTTTLLGEILRKDGLETFVAGNIGTPLIEIAEQTTENSWTVVELSSFQLETIRHFRPNIGICLNVTPNHMDRYDFFSDYAAAKHRLFMNQTEDNLAVLNADNETTSSWESGLLAHVTLFSLTREPDGGLFLRGNDLVSRSGKSERVLMSREDIRVKGLHNVENVLAASAAALACGVEPETIRAAVREFRGVEHRLEFVRELYGISFYNDSKATSVDASLKAVSSFEEESGKTVLILGGKGKNAPYEPLIEPIRRSVSAVVVIGEDAPRISRELSSAVNIVEASTMSDAVAKAFDAAKSGDRVLLAPACASYDMFETYEHRGRVFKEEVGKLG
jgi:UDP-N-acetylmuramoylalanine--D-glutamate ligase